MKVDAIHTSPSLVSDGTAKSKMSSSDNKSERKAEETRKGHTISPQAGLREWIWYGIGLEAKCLEGLLFGEKSIPEKEIAPVDGICSNGAAFDSSKPRQNKVTENTVNRSVVENEKEKNGGKSKISSSNKENATANGQAEKLDIRLPFVDWKKTLSTAVASKATTSPNKIEMAISEIVRGWLIVLAKLNQHEGCGLSSVTSFRSQIYRRLTLLLVGFVDTIGKDSEDTARIVEHTSHLARKILKEEGSSMKKKLDALPSIEIDGIQHYCFFTAIAAECSEFLGDLEKALLAYKSIRAMEQRQNKSSGVYTKKNIALKPTTVTETPVNTPTALARKTHDRRSVLFSPKAVPKMLRFHDLAQSKIGNDLVLPGTLEERILRCTTEQ